MFCFSLFWVDDLCRRFVSVFFFFSESGSSRNEIFHTPLLGTSAQPIRNLFQQQCQRCHQAIHLNSARTCPEKEIRVAARFHLTCAATWTCVNASLLRMYFCVCVCGRRYAAQKKKTLWDKLVHTYWESHTSLLKTQNIKRTCYNVPHTHTSRNFQPHQQKNHEPHVVLYDEHFPLKINIENEK